MNCPDCGEHVFGHRCSCGWYEKPRVTVSHYKGPPEPNRTAEWDARRLSAMATAKQLGNANPRAWAYKILDLHKRGEPVNLVALKNAQQAVRYDPNGGTA